MTKVIFTVDGGLICGFEMSGHSDYSEEGSDIVCSALSSAAIMAANTITEVQKIDAQITEGDGYLKLSVSPEQARQARVTLDGLLLHFSALSQEYKQFIKIQISEV